MNKAHLASNIERRLAKKKSQKLKETQRMQSSSHEDLSTGATTEGRTLWLSLRVCCFPMVASCSHDPQDGHHKDMHAMACEMQPEVVPSSLAQGWSLLW